MRAVLALAVLLLLACGPRIYQHTVTGRMAEQDLFEAARSELVDLGYSIQSADRDSGLIRAEKTRATGMFGFGQRTDRLIVSLGTERFQVTAETDEGEDQERVEVSDDAREDAERLRSRLAGGP